MSPPLGDNALEHQWSLTSEHCVWCGHSLLEVVDSEQPYVCIGYKSPSILGPLTDFLPERDST